MFSHSFPVLVNILGNFNHQNCWKPCRAVGTLNSPNQILWTSKCPLQLQVWCPNLHLWLIQGLCMFCWNAPVIWSQYSQHRSLDRKLIDIYIHVRMYIGCFKRTWLIRGRISLMKYHKFTRSSLQIQPPSRRLASMKKNYKILTFAVETR